jgi:AcrR family transcriptional regulator
MAEAVPAEGAPRASRLDRRKARTRQALIDAAVRLIAEGRGDRASIAEITEEADIGFGSFYNHFDSKEQLFATASEEVLERWGQLIDRASAGLTDPAELFAVGTRITGRLGWTHPDIAGFLTGTGMNVLDITTGLVPRALRDIEAGRAAGRFTPPAPLRIDSHSDSFSLAMSCRFPGIGSDTKAISPQRFVMIREPWPVVLYLPDHNSRSPAQDQHGHRVPSTRVTAPFTASAASSADGRNSSVTCSINGVRNVMLRDIVD